MISSEDVDFSQDLTVVVNTCDAYSDCLKLFFAALNEYWPDCDFPIVINSESNVYNCYPATTHVFNRKDGVEQWGGRLVSTLQSIDTKFVMMLYDDFILEAPVDVSGLRSVVKFLLDNDKASVVYLTQTSLPVVDGRNINNLSVVVDNSDYKLNSAPGVWCREDLLKYTGLDDSPWAWEVFGSYRTYANGRDFYTPCINAEDIYPYNYKKGGAIYRGKWVREVVGLKVRKYGLDIDTSIRGFCDDLTPEVRSFKWKIDFMRLGFRMVGVKSFIFVVRYVKAKISAKIS